MGHALLKATNQRAECIESESQKSPFSAQTALTEVALAFYDQILIFSSSGKGEAGDWGV